nr:uncharacterized protein LOC111510481 [Leptinotarsa decemlineata]
MASVENVCRLCLSNENLVSVFDKRFNSVNDIKNVILITTGVEIYEKDVISQKICKKCCHISIKMFQFRNASQENDRYLKAKYKEKLDASNVEYKIPNTCITIKTQKKVEPKIKTEAVEKPNYKIHPSVAALYTVYPGLKLPTICFKCNIEPTVSMEMNAVEDYLKKQKGQQTYTGTKHEKKTAKKSTSASTKITSTSSIDTPTTDPLDIFPLPLVKTKTNEKSDISIEDKVQKQCEYSIVSVSGIVNNEKSSSDSEMSEAEKVTIKLKRRRLTDSDFSSDPETKDSSSSEPQPKKKPVGGASDELCLDKSERLFICSICNSVHNRVRELKRHRLKHMRCQFCKSNFKTISAKISHVAHACRIKNMMNPLPTVKLDRIELDQRIRSKYPDAFKDFISSPGLQLEPSAPEDTTKCRVDDVVTKEVTEVLLDEKSTYSPCKNDTSTDFQEAKTIPNVIETTATSESLSTKSTADGVSMVTTPPVVPTKTEENDIQLSVSIVKPDIRIKNTNVLDIFDPKLPVTTLIKELLIGFSAFEFEKEEYCQTELPSNKSICVNENNQSTELKNLKSSLLVYKIPIKIKKGPFQIDYDHSTNNSHAHSPKKLCLWNDLTPIDVKVGSNINHCRTSASPNITTPGTAPSVNSLLTTQPNQGVSQNGYKSSIIALSGMVNQLASHSTTSETPLPNLAVYPQTTALNTFNTPVISYYCVPSNGVAGTSLTYADPRIDPFQPSIPAPVVQGLTFRKPRVNIERNTGRTHNLSRNTTTVPDLISKKPCITTEQNAGPVIYLSGDSVPSVTFSKSGNNMEQYTIPLLSSLPTHNTSSPNVNPFSISNVPVHRKSPLVNQNSTDITSRVSSQSVPVIQNNVSESPSHPLPATTSSDSNKTGPVFGTIRVKSVWELK